MRHAKAEPYAETDADRELTDRGRADAGGAGRFLAGIGLAPDHALVSSAARTRQTWTEVRAACGSTAAEEFSDALYDGTPATVLEIIRLVPDEVATCIYVGHNPTAAHVAAALDDGEADPEVLRGLLGGFPTAALAVFDVSGAWGELAEAGARLSQFYEGA